MKLIDKYLQPVSLFLGKQDGSVMEKTTVEMDLMNQMIVKIKRASRTISCVTQAGVSQLHGSVMENMTVLVMKTSQIRVM